MLHQTPEKSCVPSRRRLELGAGLQRTSDPPPPLEKKNRRLRTLCCDAAFAGNELSVRIARVMTRQRRGRGKTLRRGSGKPLGSNSRPKKNVESVLGRGCVGDCDGAYPPKAVFCFPQTTLEELLDRSQHSSPPTTAPHSSLGSISALSQHRRRHVYSAAGMGVPVLKMIASARRSF